LTSKVEEVLGNLLIRFQNPKHLKQLCEQMKTFYRGKTERF